MPQPLQLPLQQKYQHPSRHRHQQMNLQQYVAYINLCPKLMMKPSQPSESTPVAVDALTPEQQAMKARAERFGIPFNPSPTPRAKPTPSPAATAAATASSSAPTAASTPKEKEKAGPISGSAASLGISEDVLAKRAAKFGIDKDRAKVSAPAEKPAPVAAPAPKAEELAPSVCLVMRVWKLMPQGDEGEVGN